MNFGITKETRGQNDIVPFVINAENPFNLCRITNVKYDPSYDTKNGTVSAIIIDFSRKDSESGLTHGFRKVIKAPINPLLEIVKDSKDKEVVQISIGMSHLKEIMQVCSGKADGEIEITGSNWNEAFANIATHLNTGNTGKSIYENKPLWLKLTYPQSSTYSSDFLDFGVSPFLEVAVFDAGKQVLPCHLQIIPNKETVVIPVKVKKATNMPEVGKTNFSQNADDFFPTT